MGLVLLGIGVYKRNRKYQVTGLTFISGVLFFLLMPEAKSQTQLPEQIYYYHNDHLGTPKVVTNQARAVVWDADYSPFGEISSYVTNSLAVDQPFRFPGQYQDSLTGWYYNWNRYYMPETGKYNRVDPLTYSQVALFYPYYEFNQDIYKQLNHQFIKTRVINNSLYIFSAWQYNYNYSNSNPISYYDKNGRLIGLVIAGAIVFAISFEVGYHLPDFWQKAEEFADLTNQNLNIDKQQSQLPLNNSNSFQQWQGLQDQKTQNTKNGLQKGKEMGEDAPHFCYQ